MVQETYPPIIKTFSYWSTHPCSSKREIKIKGEVVKEAVLWKSKYSSEHRYLIETKMIKVKLVDNDGPVVVIELHHYSESAEGSSETVDYIIIPAEGKAEIDILGEHVVCGPEGHSEPYHDKHVISSTKFNQVFEL